MISYSNVVQNSEAAMSISTASMSPKAEPAAFICDANAAAVSDWLEVAADAYGTSAEKKMMTKFSSSIRMFSTEMMVTVVKPMTAEIPVWSCIRAASPAKDAAMPGTVKFVRIVATASTSRKNTSNVPYRWFCCSTARFHVLLNAFSKPMGAVADTTTAVEVMFKSNT